MNTFANIPWEIYWYLTGFVTFWFWPIRYRKSLDWQDWRGLLCRCPFYSFFGPLNIIFNFPV